MSPRPAVPKGARTAVRSTKVSPVSAVLEGLPAVIGCNTRLIVLGSFPGVASLQQQQYYGHPRNQFWPLLGAIWQIDLVAPAYPERIAELRRRGVGLWDVYARCRREGSLDQAIEEAELNDLASLRRRAPGLALVAHNGAESARAWRHTAALGCDWLRLPSTSPANAGWSFERKLTAWHDAFKRAGVG